MADVCEPFRGKKITVLGLGLLGRGVGDVEFLAGCGADVTVTDKKSEAELSASVEKLRSFTNIRFNLGGHDLKDFQNADLVVKAAGVPLDSPEIAAAKAAGVSVAMSTALFAKYAKETGATIVGVTGTRGKSTVTQMISHSLTRAGRKIVLGGNVRGVSTLAQLPSVTPGTIAVLELDSWQLQGFGDLMMSPDIAVFTNLMPDHQNYYSSMDQYFEDKANIFKYQKNGTLVVGRALADRIGKGIVPPPLPPDWTLKVIGEHNRENAALAAEALRALGLSEGEVKSGLESFEAVEGRLQFVREFNGAKIYNDNNATTPEATIAALRALGDDVTLICGGSDKGLPLDELVSEVKKRVSRVILLTHENYEGSARLAALLKKESVDYTEASSIEDAVAAAVGERSSFVLFSPAFASFGMFKNEYDRNDRFLAVVSQL